MVAEKRHLRKEDCDKTISRFLTSPNVASVSGVLDGKEFVCNMGDPGSLPGLGRSPGEGTEEPGGLQAVHGVVKSWTRLSDYTFTFKAETVQASFSWQTNGLNSLTKVCLSSSPEYIMYEARVGNNKSVK